MRAIFQQFDTDSSGFVTKENIQVAMEKMGQAMDPDEIAESLAAHDKDKDDALDFDEFMLLIKEDAARQTMARATMRQAKINDDE